MGMWIDEETPTMSFVLYTINVECMCDASYVTWKHRQYRKTREFRKKIQNFAKCKYTGGQIP